VEEVIVYDKINRSSYYIKEVTCYRGVRIVVFNILHKGGHVLQGG